MNRQIFANFSYQGACMIAFRYEPGDRTACSTVAVVLPDDVHRIDAR
jgi:hypothetical protein